MMINKWTFGLAAVGLVSLTPALRADDKPSAVQTALANTTISGYVSTSANVGLTDNYSQSLAPVIPFQPTSKENGFNLDVVKLSISKPEDESPWASGYQVDLLFGPDAVGYNTSVNSGSTADYGIKQAYVTLRTPVGNGIDWKIGVFDTVVGYEVFDPTGNANYTRSWGYWMEPTEHTGVLATYKVVDALSLSAGVANTSEAGINARNNQSGNPTGSDWHKTYLGSLTLTAPSSWGWAAGSALNAGIVYGFNDNGYYNTVNTGNGTHADGNQVNYYVGLTANTPWTPLTVGASLDYVDNLFGGDDATYASAWAADAYATYKATDKLSFSGRAEYVYGVFHEIGGTGLNDNNVEVTGTVEYDLWANVVSRLEVRWDHFLSLDDTPGYYLAEAIQPVSEGTSVGLYANLVFKF